MPTSLRRVQVTAGRTSPQVACFLEDLVAGGALTNFQACWLIEHWRELPNDWACHPFCQQVREHTRACIDHLRREARSNPDEPVH